MTFNERFPIWQNLKTIPSHFISDLRMMYSEEYYDENHDKHFNASYVVSSVLMCLYFMVDNPLELSYGFIIFISWFQMFFINGVREWYYGLKDNPFSWIDIRFGSYGGLTSGLTIVAILILVKIFLLY